MIVSGSSWAAGDQETHVLVGGRQAPARNAPAAAPTTRAIFARGARAGARSGPPARGSRVAVTARSKRSAAARAGVELRETWSACCARAGRRRRWRRGPSGRPAGRPGSRWLAALPHPRQGMLEHRQLVRCRRCLRASISPSSTSPPNSRAGPRIARGAGRGSSAGKVLAVADGPADPGSARTGRGSRCIVRQANTRWVRPAVDRISRVTKASGLVALLAARPGVDRARTGPPPPAGRKSAPGSPWRRPRRGGQAAGVARSSAPSRAGVSPGSSGPQHLRRQQGLGQLRDRPVARPQQGDAPVAAGADGPCGNAGSSPARTRLDLPRPSTGPMTARKCRSRRIPSSRSVAPPARRTVSPSHASKGTQAWVRPVDASRQPWCSRPSRAMKPATASRSMPPRQSRV